MLLVGEDRGHWGWVYGTEGAVAQKCLGTTGLVTRLQDRQLRNWGLILPGARDYLCSDIQTSSKVHQSLYPSGLGGSSPPGVERPGLEADHSSFSAQAMHVYSSICTVPYFFVAWRLIKCKGNFTCTDSNYFSCSQYWSSVACFPPLLLLPSPLVPE
jgi:hypothetical protein